MDRDRRSRAVRDMLHSWDPLAIADAEPGAYEFLVGPLTASLRAGADGYEVGELIWARLREHPGLSLDREHIAFMADELVRTWVRSGRRRRWLAVGAFVLAPLLCCLGGTGWVDWQTERCEDSVSEIRRTVQTKASPLREELAPLGGTVVEIHWVLDPRTSCSFWPVPGSELDSQVGLARLDPTAIRSIVDRYSDWEAANVPFLIPNFTDPGAPPAERRLAALVAADWRWQRSPSLDAAFTGRKAWSFAHYYVDPVHALVAFRSEADHRRAGSLELGDG